ncbi:hypothetical protein ACJW31_05G100800 [Castanea mollissima]
MPHRLSFSTLLRGNEVANPFQSKYLEVAKQFKREGISFLIGDLDASQGAFQYFGLSEDQVPLIIIQNDNGQNYLKANLEPDHIAPWVKAYKLLCYSCRSFSIPCPKEETLSRHSILGPNGLHGQWQPPISDKGVQYPSTSIWFN